MLLWSGDALHEVSLSNEGKDMWRTYLDYQVRAQLYSYSGLQPVKLTQACAGAWCYETTSSVGTCYCVQQLSLLCLVQAGAAQSQQ